MRPFVTANRTRVSIIHTSKQSTDLAEYTSNRLHVLLQLLYILVCHICTHIIIPTPVFIFFKLILQFIKSGSKNIFPFIFLHLIGVIASIFLLFWCVKLFHYTLGNEI